jgi:hypothetical protein
MRSITLVLIAALGSLSLASPGSVAAQAYEWSPQKTSTHLTGKLTFVPDGFGGASFECKVSLTFRTGNIRRGEDALPHFVSGIVKGRGCENVSLYSIPWYSGVQASPGVDGPDTIASLSTYGWRGGIEGCTAYGGGRNGLNVTPDGKTWTFSNLGCLFGSLTANPPVTSVPVP